MPYERIQKFLASWGIASRRRIEEWIQRGRILLNSQPALPGAVIKENDEITVLGERKEPLYRATLRGVYDERKKTWLKRDFEYWMVNKPKGVLSSTSDPHHKIMVTKLVESTTRLFPVGRLDIDSEGLLLLTSDGELAHRLMHPRFGVKKKYAVTLDWPVSEEIISRIRKGGVMLEDGPTSRIDVKILSGRRLELVLYEGRKREIRRIFEKFGHRVVSLVRLSLGSLELGDLATGKTRARRPVSPTTCLKRG
jgi:23S rRNA pseudouridine2605 synthase